MLIPILPLYLLDRDVPLAIVGLVVAAAPAGSILAQYPAGRLIDRAGVGWPTNIGLVVAAGCVLLLLMPFSWAFLALLRLAQGMGLAVLSPASRSAVARMGDSGERGQRFGNLASFEMAAFVGGPAVGGLLAAFGREWAIVAVAGLLALAALAFSAHLRAALRSRSPVTAQAASAEAATEPEAAEQPALVPDHESRRRRYIVGLLGLTLGSGLLFGMYLSMWSLYLERLGAPDIVIGLSFTLFALPFIAVAPLSGRLADRRDPRSLAVFATLGLGALALVFPFITVVLVAVLLGIVEGVVAAAGEPATNKLAADTAGAGREGRLFGVLGTAEAAATTAGSAMGAGLFALGVAVPFFVGAAACAVGAGLAAVCWREGSSSRRQDLAGTATT